MSGRTAFGVNLGFKKLPDGTIAMSGPLVAPGFAYPTPEEFFGASAVPSGWLGTMIAAGVRKIGLLPRRYPYPMASQFTALTVDDLEIIGAARPTVNAGKTALENGSIIDGGIQFDSANRVTIKNLGIDGGDNFTGTNPTDGHIIFSAGSRALIDGVTILGKSTARASGAHCILLQGCDDSWINDTEATYGFHSFAIKSQRVRLTNLYGKESILGITLKSDTVAIATALGRSYRCAEIDIENVRFLDLGDASGGSAVNISSGSNAAGGQDIAGLRISGLTAKWTTYNGTISRDGFLLGGQVDGAQLDRVSMDGIVCDNATFGIRIQSATLDIRTNNIGTMLVNKAARAITADVRTGSMPLHIGALTCYDTAAAASVGTFCDLYIGSLTMIGGSGDCILFNGTDSRAKVGSYRSSRPLFASAALTYQNSCVDFTGDGTTPTRLTMTGGAFLLRGKLVPGSASAATDYDVLTLPVWARPGSKRTVAVPAIAGGVNVILSLDIATTGSVTIKSLPANTTMISLDGVSWEFGL